jgi:putative transposase
VPDRICANGIF